MARKEDSMKIQIWSDFRCPFCYIGKKNLEKAIESLDGEFEIEMMSYELDPHHIATGQSQAKMLSEKYGIGVEEAKTRLNHVLDMAAKAGLKYDFDSMVDVNTFNAHKVFQYAKEMGKGNDFNELVLSGYFEKGANIDSLDYLIDLGLSLGLEESGIRNAYQSDDYALKVRQDEQHAQTIGVRGVPHFVINDAVSLSGAQPPETFKDAIKYTVDYLEKVNASMICDDDGCEI